MESLNNTTESNQMYLVSMARLAEVVEDCPIPVSQVADLLGVTSVSANQMIHNLEEMGLVTYTPYKGVEFTEEGWKSAVKTLRNRRLWEVFLVEKLQYGPQEADILACRLEHAISEETAQRLAEFLDWPEVSPKGKAIPQVDTVGSLQTGSPINSMHANASGVVTALPPGEERAYLQHSGMNIGSEIHILASQLDGSCLIKTGNGVTINISSELSNRIWVKPESSK